MEKGKSLTRSQGSPSVLLIQQQENLAALATQSARGIALLNRTQTNAPTNIQIQRKIAALEKLWEECDDTHRQLIANVNEPVVDTYITEGSFGTARRELYILIETLEGLLIEVPQQDSSDHRGDPSVQQPQLRTAMATLERISVPTFDGTLKDWPNFKDLFSALVIDDTSLSNIYKFTYLKKLLKGNALTIIKNIEISGDNFLRAWKLVTDHYQNVNSLTFSYIVRLLKLEPVDSKKPGQLERLFLQTREILASLESLKEPVKEWSSLLVVLTVLRLDSDLRQDWDHSVGRKPTFPKFSELEEFIQTRIHSESLAHVQSGVTMHGMSASSFKSVKNAEPKVKYNSHVSSSSIRTCAVCHGTSHQTPYCHTLLNLNASDRLLKIKSLKLCANCLYVGHLPRDCNKSIRCFTCNRRHNSILHDSFNTGSHNNNNNNIENITDSISSHTATQLSSGSSNQLTASGNVLLATAIVRVTSHEGREMTIRVLVDQGSERSFLSESVAQQLQLSRRSVDASIIGIGSRSPGRVRHASAVSVTSLYNQQTIFVNCLILSQLTSYSPRQYVTQGMWYHVRHLPLADTELHITRPIDMILGADVYGEIIRDGILRFPNEPIAQSTIFGWILSGPYSQSNDRNVNSLQPSSVINSLHVSSNEALTASLNRFWEIEDTPIIKFVSSEDQRCEEIFINTSTRDKEGRYTVNLPFKSDLPIEIGDSYNIALKQYMRLERRLSHDSVLNREYNAFLQDYLDLGHMSPYVPQSDREQAYYIPHHPVIKESSSTTKVRVVFNASSPTSNGKSLNDHLLIGPKLQQDLSAIILRWRLHRYAMVADAEKMFRQIRVAPEHTPFQLILWRSRVNEPISTFKLNTVTYGTSCAPFLSLRVLHQLASDEEANFPLAAHELVENTYVDDIVFGSSSIRKTQALRDEILSLTQHGCFSFRKWMSNERSLTSDLPMELCDTSVHKQFIEDTSRKVLGISWRTLDDDCFEYSVLPECPAILTKRNILSFIAKLYDPLGWIAPVVIVAKIFMQQLWLTEFGWDDIISAELSSKWYQFSENLGILANLKVPRWVGTSLDSQIQLHMFCDASQHAYAASIYIRVDNGLEVVTNLLVSKTKVAPLKSITIPRLELCAAELGSRLLVWVLSSLSQSEIPCFAWSDSSVALAWIAASPARWKVFVQNRVARIQTRCPQVSWHYVPTALNPADVASRGCDGSTLVSHELWWHGPEWLSRPRDLWPSTVPDVVVGVNTEERPIAVNVAHDCSSDFAHRCSDWGRLIRSAAVLLRYFAILRCKAQRRSANEFLKPTSEISFNFKEQARKYWIRTAQSQGFELEIAILRAKRTLPRRNRLISLTPFLDSDGILRVGGRLQNAALSNDGKHPVLLTKCHITRLIIRQAHSRTLHGGISLTARLLAENYWIIRVKTLVKSEIHRCVSCVRHRATVLSQGMAPLPSLRVIRRRAFQHVGVDYAGPVLVKYGSGRGHQAHKSYIAVFVCMNTRAIHLELVHAYTTEAFLAAFKRFTSRRGLPSLVISDNGTNFNGASRELSRDFKRAMSDPEITSVLSNDQIQWKFIPPGSPHFGGLWEAGVKSVKHHLRRVSGDHPLSIEEFNTLLCQIEACLNSRPIAGFSSNPDDLSYLTPGHFLIGSPLIAPPEPSLLHIKEARLSRWQSIQAMVERFWKVWTKDYLRSLQTRVKWRQPQPNIEINSIVLIKDENLPPARWALGRVIDCHPGSDGLTRVCQLRTAKTTLTRPIQKLCLLPVGEDETAVEVF